MNFGFGPFDQFVHRQIGDSMIAEAEMDFLAEHRAADRRHVVLQFGDGGRGIFGPLQLALAGLQFAFQAGGLPFQIEFLASRPVQFRAAVVDFMLRCGDQRGHFFALDGSPRPIRRRHRRFVWPLAGHRARRCRPLL